MNELEDFIVELNSIETQKCSDVTERVQNLARFLFSGEPRQGWKPLCALFTRKIQINSIFAEKLNDLLVSNFVKIYSHLDKSSRISSSKIDPNSLFESDLAELDAADLYTYLVVLLTLWLRTNDGTTNSHHLFEPSRALNQLADVLFAPDIDDLEYHRIYRTTFLRFLSKLFPTNFKNMVNGKRTTQKEASKHLIMEIYARVGSRLRSDEERELFITILIDYLTDYFQFVCSPGLMGPSLSSFGFESLIFLLDNLVGFVLDQMVGVDGELFISICKKLAPILVEIKSYKNG